MLKKIIDTICKPLHKKPHKCWQHGVWGGYENNILFCSECGEMLGYRYKEVFDESIYGFTPMCTHARKYENEIRERYGLPTILELNKKATYPSHV